MNIYIGLFLTAFSSLALEVTLSRLLSVVTWYHLAFFAVSTAMLGMTAGATRVYLSPKAFEGEDLGAAVARACIRYALVIPAALALLCLLPLDLQKTVMSPLAFVFATIACALPFYFSGTVLAAVLTKYKVPMGRLYAADLIGASLGCLFVLKGLELLDAPSLVLLCSAFAVLAAMCFAGKAAPIGFRRLSLALFALFVILPFANAFTPLGIRPLIVKGRLENFSKYLYEKWTSFSRVIVYKGTISAPFYWGPSPVAPYPEVRQFYMNIDGEAGTVLQKFNAPEDIEHLKYDVTNVGYYLDRKGKACVIGVGGGRDLQSAILFGHDEVTGVEVNPIFIDLLSNQFRDFAGLAGRPGVKLVVDDARAHLSSSREQFAVIQMSLIDTWAATGAGAFSLTENALYTVEAWDVFLNRLADNGLFTVSRWHSPRNIGETGRVISLAVASLLRIGVDDPQRHIALITTERISSLLISRRPFSEEDLAKLRQVCADLRYNAICLPGEPPENEILRQILACRTTGELRRATAGRDLNYEPPTDESPYFFNMLRLRAVAKVFRAQEGVLQGNLTATVTLLILLVSLAVLALATIIVPLALRERFHVEKTAARGPFLAGAVYFSMIGAAFMFLEIALIQKLSVFLGHPVYALGILLFTIIASTGVGSFLSDRLPLRRLPGLLVFPLVTVVAIVALRFLLAGVFASMMTAPVLNKIAASVAVVFPLGILMGCFFPTGMTLARATVGGDTPWFWALNGVFGMLCSVLAVFFSIFVGISTNFYLAAALYALAAVFLLRLQAAGAGVPGGESSHVGRA